MNACFRVREAELTDVDILAEYNSRLAWETEHRRLDPATVRRGVEALIRDRSKGVYFVADAGASSGVVSTDGSATGVVGQCCVTYEWSDWRNGNIWWFQSVYVEAGWRAHGVFRSLYEHVAESAKAGGVVGLRLYVEEDNLTAQEVYRRRGMTRTSYLVFEREL
ncbi:MAG: GNAT family N-acetyltransferase [Verrucomicrobiales bacterium]|nr:GNAT family N-acetyltransferase [Verrucomicrobiales bacterium]